MSNNLINVIGWLLLEAALALSPWIITAEAAERTNAVGLPNSAPTLVETKIASRTYHVPVRYLAYPVSQEDSGMLLEADWPTMALPNHEPGGLQSRLMIMVQDLATTTDVAFRLRKAREIYHTSVLIGKVDGLTEYASKLLLDPDQLQTELYVTNSEPPLFVRCDGDTTVPFPGCSEVFEANGLLFTLTFRKEHLHEWAEMRDASLKLLDRFANADK
jgi:hypothetical protein